MGVFSFNQSIYICVCIMSVQRLSSAPIPFTVLSIAGSTCNEDYLAVCGLKVFTFVVTLHSSANGMNHSCLCLLYYQHMDGFVVTESATCFSGYY